MHRSESKIKLKIILVDIIICINNQHYTINKILVYYYMNLKSAMISIDNIKYKSNIGYNQQMVYSNHKSQRFKFRPMDE